MSEPARQADPHGASLRWTVYSLLIALTLGQAAGRILAVNSVDTVKLDERLRKENPQRASIQRPFLSANDRSRWCTVRALVEEGTYSIDNIIQQPGWDTIDMVKYNGRLYSSKPPLLATLLAGPYWVIHRLSGHTLGTHPYEIGRALLILCNLVPLGLYLLTLAALAERVGQGQWDRLLMMAAACFATFLTTFAIVVNNHLPAAVCAALAVACVLPVWFHGERRLRYFFLSGLFGALTVAFELPALALFALVSAGLLYKAPRPACLAYLPAALLVAAAYFGTNYAALGTFDLAYRHRHDQTDEQWYRYTYQRGDRTIDSYWKNPQGIDKGESSRAAYALHLLVGHHGIFSLTPIWLLSVGGWILAMLRRDLPYRQLAWAVALVSVVCIAFYISRPMEDRNYGGMTSGPRWIFWMAPLWLVTLLPAAHGLSRWMVGRGAMLVLLLFSALSASYPTWNPWTHPWLMNFFLYMEWVKLP